MESMEAYWKETPLGDIRYHRPRSGCGVLMVIGNPVPADGEISTKLQNVLKEHLSVITRYRADNPRVSQASRVCKETLETLDDIGCQDGIGFAIAMSGGLVTPKTNYVLPSVKL